MSGTEEWDAIKSKLENGLDDVFMLIMGLGDDETFLAFVDDARERYEKGRAQHAGSDSTWEAWSDGDFAKNIREELIDCVIYAAARIVREKR